RSLYDWKELGRQRHRGGNLHGRGPLIDPGLRKAGHTRGTTLFPVYCRVRQPARRLLPALAGLSDGKSHDQRRWGPSLSKRRGQGQVLVRRISRQCLFKLSRTLKEQDEQKHL